MTTERPDGVPAGDDLGWTLGVLLRAYQGTVVTVLGDLPHGPRGYQTLAAVVGGAHPTQLALAAHLGIDRTVLTYLLDDLVAAGLVERRLNPADRRQRRIVATGAGTRTFGELERRVRAAEDGLLGALDAAERDTFRTLLRRVACAVRDIEPATDPCDVAEELLSDGR
ncbi:winged helix-turn-helix transcriptional regulator [Nonomuraea sp. MG754425]|uniref:MarR family winged helix-turn-helix transcriptional regulator n=1 Tax=Nonomuraea sp. MG754425 TaxID=2570319 RepID=UPI001F33041C|nr:MarR family winged helix-turn-helix transcriptional regulator [Nonomuraea sp. MG754425]MCF6470372.1 winged helix-turn-helix transcriptional regulator [Nonomuraea sp. MG754425]